MNYDYNRAASDDRGPQSNNPLSEQRPSTNINKSQDFLNRSAGKFKFNST